MKKLLFLILLLPIFAHGQWVNVGNALQMTSDGHKHRFSLGSQKGVWPVYGSVQTDSAEINNGTSVVQNAGFNINGNGIFTGGQLQMPSGTAGYETDFVNQHNTILAFRILNDGVPIITSSLGARTITFGSVSTLNTTFNGSILVTGKSVAVNGAANQVYINGTLYPSANGDTLAGARDSVAYSSGAPITALNNSTLVQGSGYVPGTYTNVQFTESVHQSVGALGTIVVNGSGNVSSVTITYGGIFYGVGYTLTASNAFLGGTGSGFQINVLTVGTYSSLKNIGHIIYGGMMLVPTIYSKLPAVLMEGSFFAITDANVNSWGSVVSSGGGSDHIVAYYDGSALTVAAK